MRWVLLLGLHAVVWALGYESDTRTQWRKGGSK